ncbi:uncharacterized protein K444DRAFT_668889 [Hyaloscypha bicolor E]|uniref:Uncharacterized protein n=1 Tax=Hyaloscypha bicolor E TaxID=1095630 RepID=A0A2J6SNY2_9HELO|nr:uncharacterized protein K444DRAFT_668889 [Hyaloscypha bicolor E]PMD52430.1 hypothetical protein K444DRAFT_668889 [Hyaloscypha bicolor E]
MSVIAKNTALVLLGAVGAVAAVNALKPSKTAGIANAMRTQLDQINTHVEQDRSRKPWNQTSAEREAMRKTGDGDWRLRNEGESKDATAWGTLYTKGNSKHIKENTPELEHGDRDSRIKNLRSSCDSRLRERVKWSRAELLGGKGCLHPTNCHRFSRDPCSRGLPDEEKFIEAVI